jgi:hypothetical protein
LKASQLDSFFLEVLGVEADLRSLMARLRVTSSDGGKSWPELGFTGTAERARAREEREGGGGGLLGFLAAADVVL